MSSRIKFTLLVSFFLWTAAAQGQSNRFNVAVEISPAVSKNFADSERSIESEAMKFTTSYAILVNYKKNDRTVLETGLKYVEKGGVRTENIGAVIDYILTVPNPNFIPKYENRYKFLAIPLNIKASLGKGIDKGWYLRFGLSPAFYLSGTSFLNYNDAYNRKRFERIEILDEPRKVNLIFNTGLGYTFLLQDKYQICVEPVMELMLFKLFRKQDYGQNNYSEYHSLGLSCQFMIK